MNPCHPLRTKLQAALYQDTYMQQEYESEDQELDTYRMVVSQMELAASNIVFSLLSQRLKSLLGERENSYCHREGVLIFTDARKNDYTEEACIEDDGLETSEEAYEFYWANLAPTFDVLDFLILRKLNEFAPAIMLQTKKESFTDTAYARVSAVHREPSSLDFRDYVLREFLFDLDDEDEEEEDGELATIVNRSCGASSFGVDDANPVYESHLGFIEMRGVWDLHLEDIDTAVRNPWI